MRDLDYYESRIAMLKEDIAMFGAAGDDLERLAHYEEEAAATRTVPSNPLPEKPTMRLKHLLVFAVSRLTALGDDQAVEHILAELPPVEKGARGHD